VDLSPRLVARAQERATGRTNVEVRVADAQTATLEPTFDVIMSRFGLMFFDDPRAAFANLRAALVPDGRLVAICWQALHGNDWMRVPGEALATVVPLGDVGEPGQPGPFSLGDRATVEAILTGAGWHDVRLDPVDAPVLLSGGGTLDDAVGYVGRSALGRSALAGVPPEVEAKALAAVRDARARRGCCAPDPPRGASCRDRLGGRRAGNRRRDHTRSSSPRWSGVVIRLW
jgi:SAM-dependent methyltransferase